MAVESGCSQPPSIDEASRARQVLVADPPDTNWRSAVPVLASDGLIWAGCLQRGAIQRSPTSACLLGLPGLAARWRGPHPRAPGLASLGSPAVVVGGAGSLMRAGLVPCGRGFDKHGRQAIGARGHV